MAIELICAVCGTSFKVFPARIRAAEKLGTTTKYCSKACANIGQAHNRVVWNKGLTKETDPRLQQTSEAIHKLHQEHPEVYSGDNHWTRKQPMTVERLEHMQKMRDMRPPLTSAQHEGLERGRSYFRGRTKENDPSVARRSRILSHLYKGKENPAHAEWLRKYYEENPEKHPNILLSQKGHETSIERIMRIALEDAGIAFQPQYRVERYFIDFAILSHFLAIEVDGAYWHDPERDAQRDAVLQSLGWHVIRFSEDRVNQEIHECVSEICQLLL